MSVFLMEQHIKTMKTLSDSFEWTFKMSLNFAFTSILTVSIVAFPQRATYYLPPWKPQWGTLRLDLPLQSRQKARKITTRIMQTCPAGMPMFGRPFLSPASPPRADGHLVPAALPYKARQPLCPAKLAVYTKTLIPHLKAPGGGQQRLTWTPLWHSSWI